MRRSAAFLMIVVLLVPLFLVGPSLDACSTFVIKDGERLVFGRNYDWGVGVGLVMVNKRNMAKTALIAPTDKPARWISKFGSITFNQYGRELPMGGMNEAGLVVEVMWMNKTKYPAPDERTALRELGWVQYQLDNCKSVSEVIATDSKIRITGDSAPIHFLVCDESGAVAAVEFLEGKMKVHEADTLPVTALTNNTYAESIQYAKLYEGLGGKRPVENTTSSLDRFVQAGDRAMRYRSMKNIDIIDYAFGTLKIVSQGDFTRWSIVYDVKNRAIRFRTREAPAIKSLDFKAFDFSGTTPCRVLEIDTKKPGDAAAAFVDYTTEINKKLVYESWKKTSFLKGTPDAVLDMLAAYPKTIKCVEDAAENK